MRQAKLFIELESALKGVSLWVLAYQIALCAIGFWAYLAVTSHGKSQEVYTYTANGQVDMGELRTAMWDVSERIGGNLHWMGDVNVGYMPNAITVRVGSFAEWDAAAIPSTTDALASHTHGDDPGCEIVIKPLSFILGWVNTGLLAHELMHCTGSWAHSRTPWDTLYPTAALNGVTQHDAQMVLASPTWPAVKAPGLCHAALDAQWNLTIPEIGGYFARLRYLGGLRWEQVAVYPFSGIGCAGNVLSGDSVTLGEVRAQTGERYRASLRWDGSAWVAVSALPL